MDKIAILRKGKSLSVTAEECKYNSRIKLYPSSCNADEWLPVQQMVSTSFIFNPDNVTLDKKSITPKIFKGDEAYSPDRELLEQQNALRALRRAKCKLYDLIRCNLDLRYFVTLTISSEHCNRENYSEVIKKFSTWTDNKVRRKGLKYVGVVERHKKSNGLHFHLLCNNALDYVLSGTVKVPNHKKPIKVSTADRYHIPESDWQFVYNIPEWKFGFTTAIEIINDDKLLKCSHYLCKYLTKDFEKIGGRYYYNGGKLLRPRYEYSVVSFNDVVEDYAFCIDGTDLNFKVINFED